MVVVHGALRIPAGDVQTIARLNLALPTDGVGLEGAVRLSCLRASTLLAGRTVDRSLFVVGHLSSLESDRLSLSSGTARSFAASSTNVYVRNGIGYSVVRRLPSVTPTPTPLSLVDLLQMDRATALALRGLCRVQVGLICIDAHASAWARLASGTKQPPRPVGPGTEGAVSNGYSDTATVTARRCYLSGLRRRLLHGCPRVWNLRPDVTAAGCL
jgi:hypothetical protein